MYYRDETIDFNLGEQASLSYAVGPKGTFNIFGNNMNSMSAVMETLKAPSLGIGNALESDMNYSMPFPDCQLPKLGKSALGFLGPFYEIDSTLNGSLSFIQNAVVPGLPIQDCGISKPLSTFGSAINSTIFPKNVGLNSIITQFNEPLPQFFTGNSAITSMMSAAPEVLKPIELLSGFQQDWIKPITLGISSGRYPICEPRLPVLSALTEPNLPTPSEAVGPIRPGAFQHQPLKVYHGRDQAVSTEVDRCHLKVPVHVMVAFEQIFILEMELRSFIAEAMECKFGSNWTKKRLPKGMHDRWTQKKEAGLSSGELDQPLINYADFTDYVVIFEKNDNWRELFQGYFGRKELIQAAMAHLMPLRVQTCHSRIFPPKGLRRVLTEVDWILECIQS